MIGEIQLNSGDTFEGYFYHKIKLKLHTITLTAKLWGITSLSSSILKSLGIPSGILVLISAYIDVSFASISLFEIHKYNPSNIHVNVIHIPRHISIKSISSKTNTIDVHWKNVENFKGPSIREVWMKSHESVVVL